jgi:hypothetical protein
MASGHPQDFGAVIAPPEQAAQVQRISINLGTFTANTTKTTLAHIFDRPAVIREIWFAADAVPNDADGAMLIDVQVRDKSEAAFDLIVDDFNAEGLTVAFNAAKASFVAESAENELSVEAGDSLRFQQISNSAAIDTNANIVATVLYQVRQSLD